MSAGRAPKVSRAICALLLVAQLASHLGRCQISDGDEQFEAVHQDIGRLSGLSNSAQVAPQSALVARQPAATNQPQRQQQQLVAQVFDREPSGAGGSGPQAQRQQQQQQQQRASRKPNRITLVARRDPLPATLTTVAQPALIAAQLPAPPQQQPQQQPQSQPQLQPQFQSQLPAPGLAQEQPAFTPSFVPLAPVQSPHFEQPATLGPALSSFRSASSAPGGGGLANSVSARHAALMAQVAAERATAASLIGSEPASSGPAPLGLAPPPQEVPAGPQQLQQLQPHQQHQPQQQQQQQQQHQQAGSALVPLAAVQRSQHAGHLATAPTSAQGQAAFLRAPEEPAPAPSFEHVLGHGCPRAGVFSWENRDHCDRYYLCTNGTFTEEACPNGLAYSQQGAVYQHCAYNWNVNCGQKRAAEPIASPGCPWQFGLFPIVQNGRCSIDYFACEWGVPESRRCSPEGLFYDDRIKGCQWADQLGCKSEKLLNFKCPPEDEDNPYWPYPRYYHDARDVIVCVNEQPRLVHCNEDQLVDAGSLACIDVNKNKNKNKKKPF